MRQASVRRGRGGAGGGGVLSALVLFPGDALAQYPSVRQCAPRDIEPESFRVIAGELAARGIVVPEERRSVVFRAIHASADFDYAESLVFSPGALDAARDVLSRRPVIVTDTNMAKAGISALSCARLGIETCCFMADGDVAEASRRSGLTRAACAVDKAARLFAGGERLVLFVCGNAPTALVRLRQLHDARFFSPAFVVGVPVGFVNVVAAKELVLRSGLPHIVARGRKGGSSVAAAIVNALLYQA